MKPERTLVEVHLKMLDIAETSKVNWDSVSKVVEINRRNDIISKHMRADDEEEETTLLGGEVSQAHKIRRYAETDCSTTPF